MKVQTEERALVRDVHSKALLLNDKNLADDYKSRRKMFKEQNNVRNEIDSIKSDILEIKQLLQEVLKK